MPELPPSACISRRHQINLVLDQNIESVSLNYLLALELAREGNIAVAMLQFRRVRELDPYFFSAYIQDAIMLANEGCFSLSRKILSEGIPKEREIDDFETLLQMEELLKKCDRIDVD